jgi:hypothetical protein
VFKFFVAAVLGIVLSGALVAGTSANAEARVRVIHASPDAPAVDIYANGNRVLSNVPFKTASDYLSVPAGSYTFEVRPAGAAPASAPVLSATARLEAGTDYTVAALGRLAEIKAGVFIDNNAAPAAGNAHVKVIHASPDAPAVDVYANNSVAVVQNISFGEAQGPVPVPAGTYNLQIRPAGTTQVALPVDGVAVQAGRVYTFVAVGLLSGDPALSVLPIAVPGISGAVSAPHAGDAGLAAATEAGSSSYLLLAGAAAALIALAGFGGLRAVRARSDR